MANSTQHLIRVLGRDQDGSLDVVCEKCGDWGDADALHGGHCYGSETARLAHEGGWQ